MYRFVTHDCGGYLPHIDTVTVWHMRDLVGKRRHLIKSGQVKHVIIPQFDGLAIKDLLHYARRHELVMKALPEMSKEIENLPR